MAYEHWIGKGKEGTHLAEEFVSAVLLSVVVTLVGSRSSCSAIVSNFDVKLGEGEDAMCAEPQCRGQPGFNTHLSRVVTYGEKKRGSGERL